MNITTKIITLILCVAMLLPMAVFADTTEQPTADDKLIVAYFNASVPITSYEFTNIDVINYHPATIKSSAQSYTPGDIIEDKCTDKLDKFRNAAYEQNPDIKFVYTVATNNLQVFQSWFTTSGNAQKLADEMLKVIEKYGYDGLDVDYEFPSAGTEAVLNSYKRNYVKFMQYMREGFNALAEKTGKDYVLSMAVPGTSWAFSLFNMNDLANYVDYFNIMNYDLNVGEAHKGISHHHTPVYDSVLGGSVYSDIQLYLNNGIPADKIVIGCGMYARRWTGVANVNNGLYQAGTLDDSNIHYTELKSLYVNRRGYTRYWDDVAKAPWLYNPSTGTFLTYDDEQSVEEKCKVVMEQDVRGVMFFDYCTTDGIGFFDNVQSWLDKYAHTHEYTSEVTTEPTCVDKGVLTYTCECGDSYTEEIKATGEHTYGDWVITMEPTYFEEGRKIKECTGCDKTKFEIIPMKHYENPFIDVKNTAWYADEVAYCVKKGYISGMTETTFVPNGNITREQFVRILSKVAEADLSVYEGVDSGMSDVPTGKWYSNSIAWAVQEGYVSGVKEGVFGLGMPINRASLARLFYVYARDGRGMDVEEKADLSVYTDYAKVQTWMKDGLGWAVNVGLVTSTKSDALVLDPNGSATRAQAARMFMVFDELY